MTLLTASTKAMVPVNIPKRAIPKMAQGGDKAPHIADQPRPARVPVNRKAILSNKSIECPRMVGGPDDPDHHD